MSAFLRPISVNMYLYNPPSPLLSPVRNADLWGNSGLRPTMKIEQRCVIVSMQGDPSRSLADTECPKGTRRQYPSSLLPTWPCVDLFFHLSCLRPQNSPPVFVFQPLWKPMPESLRHCEPPLRRVKDKTLRSCSPRSTLSKAVLNITAVTGHRVALGNLSIDGVCLHPGLEA